MYLFVVDPTSLVVNASYLICFRLSSAVQVLPPFEGLHLPFEGLEIPTTIVVYDEYTSAGTAYEP